MAWAIPFSNDVPSMFIHEWLVWENLLESPICHGKNMEKPADSPWKKNKIQWWSICSFAVFRPLKYARFCVAIATSSFTRNPTMEVVEGSASYGGCDYDAIAAQYDSLHKDPKSLQEDLAIAGFLREYVAPGCKVLDLGCGTGLLLELLALQPEDYLGIDHSEKMLEELQSKFPEHETKKKAFGAEDLEDVDVAVSLFGPISYVDPDLVFQLVSSGVNYFLMFYKEDYRPVTYDTCQVHPYPFQRYNLPSQDFGRFAVVTNLRTPDGSLAFPRQSLRRAERAKTELPLGQSRAAEGTRQCEGFVPGGNDRDHAECLYGIWNLGDSQCLETSWLALCASLPRGDDDDDLHPVAHGCSLPPCGRSSQRDECANGQPRLGDVGSDGFRKVWPAAVLWLCPCGSLWRLVVRSDRGIKSTAISIPFPVNCSSQCWLLWSSPHTGLRAS